MPAKESPLAGKGIVNCWGSATGQGYLANPNQDSEYSKNHGKHKKQKFQNNELCFYSILDKLSKRRLT